MLLELYILDILQKQEKPIKRFELLCLIRIQFPEVNDRVMRKTVEKMIQDGGLIRSSEQGYSLIKTELELNEAVSYLDKKAEAIAIRKNTLIHNWREKNKTEYQPKLF